jgi:heme oxygenase
MIERLNEATRAHHADAESDFDLLFGNETTPRHYLTYLVRVYGFEAPLESTLSMTPNLELMIDLKERTKAGYLAQDLIALGLRPAQVAELPQCLAIPQFNGAAEALGWMYVVERTTLAHSVLRRHLLTRLPREMRSASNYLSSYTGVVGTHWRKFGSTLDDLARTPELVNRILSAANDAFRCQRRWIEQDSQDRRVAI